MWHDFPVAIMETTGCDALIYDRWGHGKSESLDVKRTLRYVHDEALNSLPALLAAAIALSSGGFAINAPHFSLINGGIVIPISFFCLAYAPRILPGPAVAMFYLIETILAPIWVWIAFAEAPTRMTLVGGTIMLTALLAHSAWQAGLFKTRTP